MNFTDRYNELKDVFEASLEKALDPGEKDYKKLIESMRYSLLAGGKRVRPIMAMAFCEASGGKAEDGLPAARAVEMLHTYSLIHDDLPCMDDDDLRRGRPSNHIVYGLMTATLSGDALQARAFYEILSCNLLGEVRAECGKILAKAAGEEGMCAGQYLDMQPGYGKTLEQLDAIHIRKTAAMISAACEMGVVSGRGSPKQLDAAKLYAQKVGLAFQIEDDLLDRYGDVSTLGKNLGSDEKAGKSTFLDLYGEEKCKSMIRELTDGAKAAVNEAFSSSDFLEELAEMLAGRKY